MPTIAALTIYPVKSCAGMSLQAALLTEAGLSHEGVGDRQWMVVDRHGQFLTQREYPGMALIRPSISGKNLVLHAPDIPPLSLSKSPGQQDPLYAPVEVQIWDDRLLAHDCGDNAAAWFATLLGVECRLVRFMELVTRPVSPAWIENRVVSTLFSDAYPLLLTSVASLEDLNLKLRASGRAEVPMNRFRPNIVLDGITAFEEEYTQLLIIGRSDEDGPDICLKPVKPCARCPIPAVDQITAKIGPNPVDILQSYRANALLDGVATFGMNTILIKGAGRYLQVGDEVTSELAF